MNVFKTNQNNIKSYKSHSLIQPRHYRPNDSSQSNKHVRFSIHRQKVQIPNYIPNTYIALY